MELSYQGSEPVLLLLFLGFCVGLAVFPLGMLIRELLLAIRSARPISMAQARPMLRLVYPAPRPNVRDPHRAARRPGPSSGMSLRPGTASPGT